MSRHRDIRNMDYSEDYDGYDDVYGHSVDDDYYISPSNRQFLYSQDRSDSCKHSENDIQEVDEFDELSDIDKAKMESCLEQVNLILGSDFIVRSELIKLILKYGFDNEQVVNAILADPKYQKSAADSNQDSDPPLVKSIHPITTKVFTSTKTTSNIIKGFEVATEDANIIKDSNAAVNLPSRSLSPLCQKNMSLLSVNDEEETINRKPKVDPVKLFQTERGNEKTHLYMIVIGHVDAGKSTLMGRLLCDLGQISKKTIHKYEQESKKLGKQSFMYAWVLDETGEERNRGITMDVGKHQFEIKNKIVTLLDAPGHKDFIPNMISGGGQADVALLVVDASNGEFEAGFEQGGQTREHALLVRSLGIVQLAVVINKLDNVSWSQNRFNEIVQKLKNFLKQGGFKESDVTFVPCSGLTGQNLVKPPTEDELLMWYNGPCLVDVIDSFRPPERSVAKPTRFSVSDIFKGISSAYCVGGRLDTGIINVGDKLLVCPNQELAVVKNLYIDESSRNVIFAGDHAVITLSGIEMQNLSVGNILCDPSKPVPVAFKFEARIVVFNVTVPITRGFSIILHHQSLVEPVIITKLISQLNKATGEVLKKHPRFLGNNTSAIVEITSSKPLALECYSDCKELGRVMLRIGGVTIASGLITKVIL